MRLVAIALILGLTYANDTGLRAGKVVQNGFTVAKALVLVALVVLGVIATPHLASALHQPRFFGAFPAATLGPAMVGAFFSATGWEQITFTAGEVRNPQRNVPGSLVWGTGVVVALYLAVNVAYLAVLPLDGIAHAPSDRVASAMVEAALGPGAAVLIAVGILVSTFGCANGFVLAGARVSYAMAKDGLFLRSAGRLNRQGVPGVALWMQAAWSCLLCLSGTYSELLDYVVFAVLVFYVLTVLAIFALRRTPRERAAPLPGRRLSVGAGDLRARRLRHGGRACSSRRRRAPKPSPASGASSPERPSTSGSRAAPAPRKRRPERETV